MSATCEILVDDPDGRIQRLQKQCGQRAVIHYDGRNLCADHADQNIVALIDHVNFLIDNNGMPSRDGVAGVLLAALAPKDDE